MTAPAPAAPAPAGRPVPEAHARRRSRREWVWLLVGAIAVAALCLAAGWWQWTRYQTKAAAVEIIQDNYYADPVPVEELLPGPGAALDPADVWRPVTMTGTYRAQDTALLRNRPVSSTGGYHVLVPFELAESGVVIIVNRGFVPLGQDASAPSSVPAAPEGPVEVVARLRADEPATDRGAPAGQVQMINTAQVLAATGSDVDPASTVGGYAALVAEDPAPAEAPGALPPPALDLGSHLSYTMQWVVFAAGAIGGYVILLRRERREVAEQDGVDQPVALPADVPDDVRAWVEGGQVTERSRRRKGRPTDEELEDAEIEASTR